MPRKSKKKEAPKVEQPPRLYYQCPSCGSKRTDFNYTPFATFRTYFCKDCSVSWEVPMEVINTQDGY